MAPKTKEQFTVICDGLFLKNEKPAEWNQPFPWKASVGFHYRVLDDEGMPIDEVHKKYLKEIWLFQAMGGKNAKDHYFRCTAEHGEVPARDGKPATPYVTVMPIAEVFADGTSHFIDPPKDGKITVPASAPKLKGSVAPPPAKAPASGPQAPKPAPPGPAKPFINGAIGAFGDPNTKKAAAFFADLEKPQSDGWWTMKTQIGYDGADACNVLDHAKQMALIEVSKNKYEGEDPAAEMRADANEAIDYWVGIMRTRLLAMKFSNIRERLSHHLKLCVSIDNLDKVLYKAWVELPESDFLALRSEAVARMRVIQSQTEDGVFKGKVIGTLQPEVAGNEKPFTPDELEVPPDDDGGAETPSVPEKANAPEETVITHMIRGINNITDWKKLVTFWETATPELQKVDGVRQAMRLWVADFFMRAKYQVNVDGMREKTTEMGLMTPDLESTLNQRYSELVPF